jgi:hypothetical protein
MLYDEWTCWQWLCEATMNMMIEFYIDEPLQARVVDTGMGCTPGPANAH